MIIITFSHYTELLYTSSLLLDDLNFKNVGAESKDFACLCMPLFMSIVSFTEQKAKFCISFATLMFFPYVNHILRTGIQLSKTNL